MDLINELGVDELEGCFSLVLTCLVKTKRPILVLKLLALSLQLSVDFVSVVELLLQQGQLLLGYGMLEYELLMHFIYLGLVSELLCQIIDAQGQLGLTFGIGATSRSQQLKLAKFTRENLIKLDLSALVNAQLLLWHGILLTLLLLYALYLVLLYPRCEHILTFLFALLELAFIYAELANLQL